MAHTYLFGGLRLLSEIRFPELREIDEGQGDSLPLAAIFYDLEPAPEPEQELFAWCGRYGMSLWAAGDDWLFRSAQFGSILVSRDGRQITCHPDPTGDPDGLQDLLIKRILPRVCLLRGRIAIHAAAVAQSDGCLLLLGASGAGKSTLSAFLAGRGWSLLSDDATVIDPQNQLVLPSARGACVWPDSRQALGQAPDRCRSLSLYDSKTWFETPGAPVTTPAPMRGFIFLERSPEVTEPTLVPLSSAEVLIRATQQLIRFCPKDRKMSGSLVDPLNRVTRGSFGYRLRYPADYGALPDIATALGELLVLRAAA